MSMTSRTAMQLARAALAAVLCFAQPAAHAEEEPNAQEILKLVRLNQAADNRALRGSVRTGGKSVPFRLSSTGNTVRYEFGAPPMTLQLRLGENDARFEEITDGQAARIKPARYDDRVRDTDITYEDLALRFLYWTRATVRGEQTMVLQKCWIVRVEPTVPGDSQYSKVDLWIGKKNGALMQAEAFGKDGKLARKFKVISGQPIGDGLWILKQMRIEAPTNERFGDRTPTYLEIDGVEK